MWLRIQVCWGVMLAGWFVFIWLTPPQNISTRLQAPLHPNQGCTVPVFTWPITQQQSCTTTKWNCMPPSTAHQHHAHLYNTAYLPKSGPGSVVGITTGYRLDGPGIESRWGGRFSAPVQTGPGAHTASCTMGTRSFPGVKSGRGVTLTPHPLLVPWSWEGRAIPLLPLWAVQPVQSLSACTRVHFTFTFYLPNLPHYYTSWIALPWRWRLWTTHPIDKIVASQMSWTFLLISLGLLSSTTWSHRETWYGRSIIILLNSLQSVITKWQTCNILMQDRYWLHLTWCQNVVYYIFKKICYFLWGQEPYKCCSWYDSSN